MTTFASRLKVTLSQKGMKPSVLAYRCGVDRSTISNYLNSKYVPKTEMILKICEVLEVDAEWLSGYTSPLFTSKAKKITVPVLGYVAAGIPIEAVEEVLDYERKKARGRTLKETAEEWYNEMYDTWAIHTRKVYRAPYRDVLEEFAHRIGFTARTISAWEGSKGISIKEIIYYDTTEFWVISRQKMCLRE